MYIDLYYLKYTVLVSIKSKPINNLLIAPVLALHRLLSHAHKLFMSDKELSVDAKLLNRSKPEEQQQVF